MYVFLHTDHEYLNTYGNEPYYDRTNIGCGSYAVGIQSYDDDGDTLSIDTSNIMVGLFYPTSNIVDDEEAGNWDADFDISVSDYPQWDLSELNVSFRFSGYPFRTAQGGQHIIDHITGFEIWEIQKQQ